MPITAGYLGYVLDQLSGLSEVVAKRTFGGVGPRCGEKGNGRKRWALFRRRGRYVTSPANTGVAEYALQTSYDPAGPSAFATTAGHDQTSPQKDRCVGFLERLCSAASSRSDEVMHDMDPRMVRIAVELKYKDLLELKESRGEDTRGFGASYFEKIMTFAVHVPEVNAKELVDGDDTSDAAAANTDGSASAGSQPRRGVVRTFPSVHALPLLFGTWVVSCIAAGVPEPLRAEAEAEKPSQASSSDGTSNAAAASNQPAANPQPSAAKPDPATSKQAADPDGSKPAPMWIGPGVGKLQGEHEIVLSQFLQPTSGMHNVRSPSGSVMPKNLTASSTG